MSKSTDGPISRYINRKISSRITSFIIRHNISITPNQVSFISFLIGVFAALLYLLWLPIIAGIMVQIASIIDGVDGELARATNRMSKKGGFIDAILDRFVDISVVMCLSVFSIWYYGQTLLLEIVIMFALSGTILVSYIHARGEASLGKHPLFIGKVPNFASRDVRLFIIFCGSILGFYMETLALVGILAMLYVTLKFIDVAVKFRESIPPTSIQKESLSNFISA